MGHPRPLFHLFSVFSNKQYKFYYKLLWKICPSSIWHQDSNSQPSDCESPPLTTRPGLPPMSEMFSVLHGKAYPWTIELYLSATRPPVWHIHTYIYLSLLIPSSIARARLHLLSSSSSLRFEERKWITFIRSRDRHCKTCVAITQLP